MRVTHIITFACLSLMAATARAQPPAPTGESSAQGSATHSELLPTPHSLPGDDAGMTLADLQQLALQNNPTWAQAQARVQAAWGKWEQVGLYPNPVAGYSGGEMGNEGATGQHGGFIGQELVTGGKLGLNRAVVSQEIARLEQELAAQQLRIVTDVELAFYQVLVAQRTMELADQLGKLAEQGLQAAEALLKAKEASRVDLLQARVERNTARILLANAQNRHRAAWRRLTAIVGIPDMAVQQLAGDVEAGETRLEWEEAVSRLLSESPELRAAMAEVQAAQWAAERARVEWVPNIEVQASIQHDNATGDDITGVQVALPLPLFNKNQGNILAADARVVAARRNVDRIRLALQNRLADVYRQYTDAAAQVEKYRAAILPDAKETLDLVASGYRQGEFGYLELLTAQRTYFQSSLAYLEALLELKTARARIDGLLLGDSLSGPTAVPEAP